MHSLTGWKACSVFLAPAPAVRAVAVFFAQCAAEARPKSPLVNSGVGAFKNVVGAIWIRTIYSFGRTAPPNDLLQYAVSSLE